MNRREFVAGGAGGGALLVAGLGAVLGDGRLDDGPAYGAVATPPNSGTITLDNGLEASLYADGTVALFGASLTVDIEGGTAIAGRLRNVSERLELEQLVLRQRLLRGQPGPVTEAGGPQHCAGGHADLQEITARNHAGLRILPSLIPKTEYV